MDINGDGFKDLIVGEEDGSINLFLRKSDGTLEAGQKVQSGSGAVKVANNSSPLVVDWDNDGDYDLLVGQKGPSEYSSDIQIYINEGSSSTFSLKRSGSVEVGGQSMLKQFYRAQLEFVDLDRDGLKDLIVANANLKESNGNVGFLKNSGTKSKPEFTQWVNLQADGSDISMAKEDPGASKKDARARVCDWNGDGIPDIIAACNHLFLYQGSGETGIIVEEVSDIGERILLAVVDNQLIFTSSAFVNQHVEAQLYTLSGRLVQRCYLNGNRNGVRLPFSQQASGVYIVQIHGHSHSVKSRIVIP